MSKLLRTILLSLTFYSCKVIKPSSEKCSEFRSGRYIFNLYNESGLGHWTKLTYFIIRNDSSELVTSTHFPQDTSIYRVTWIGDCEYKTLLLNPKISLDSFLVNKHPLGINNTITKATNKYFIIKNDGNTRDTIWKIK